MSRAWIRLAALVAGAALAGCSGGSASERHEHHEDDHEHAGPAGYVDIPPTVRAGLGITFARVQRRQVIGTIRVPGAFELQPLARHDYRLMLPGYVELRVRQFQQVSKGDLLFRLRSPEWTEICKEILDAEQAIASAEARIAVAAAAVDENRAKLLVVYRRLQALAGANVRRADLETERDALRAASPRLEAEVRAARTARAGAARRLEHALGRASSALCVNDECLREPVVRDGKTVHRCHTIDWIEVRAAQDGVVEKLAVTDGAWAEDTTLVLSIIEPEKVRFRAMGMQADLARFADGQRARIVLPRTHGTAGGDSVPARLTVGLEADPQRRTVELLATPAQGRPWTRRGVSAFLEIPTVGDSAPVLAIPRSAVVRDGTVHVFFRRDPGNPNRAIRVEADLGADNGQWVEIRSGVMQGDEVVLDGVYELKLATARGGGTAPSGHLHGDGTFHGGGH